MDTSLSKATWIWHPEWIEEYDGTSAGGFVHFRKIVTIQDLPTTPVRIQITADTKYKLYINSRLVFIGPVKGDEHLWFYDELDIQPYLKAGRNHFGVRVLRFYNASLYAPSFARLPLAGLLIRNVDGDHPSDFDIQSDTTWETALDLSTRLPTTIKEDDFLHVYEDVDNGRDIDLKWEPARPLKLSASHGLTAPWKLSQRLIPFPRYEPMRFKAIHNIRSTESRMFWERTLLNTSGPTSTTSIRLPAGTSHHLELEVEYHMTALLDFRFGRPTAAGSTLRVTYSECYENTPEFVPYLRCKSDRCDTTKKLIGPEDKYVFGGIASSAANLRYHEMMEEEEIFAPFHFRTLRFIALDIDVTAQSDLVMKGIDLTTTNYPLQILADFNTPATQDNTLCRELWTTSIRTLSNCMHDCYEDCPFYEQLQYAMDTRSSALFTYYVSGDDRMARQAIMQLHNSYRPSMGLTASRAPSHQYQIIPHFSLFWVCMITDHFEHFGDTDFARQFTPACDGVFESFARRLDPKLGLVRSLNSSTQWDFVDWTELWRPMGIPPAAARTGFQTYTNMLYAYSLKRAANLLIAISRPALAEEYQSRADAIVHALKTHCFDGHFFTDGLACKANPDTDRSQHNQIWAILCGAATGKTALEMLSECISSRNFTPTSIAMSFYTLRALSMVGGNLYDEHFHAFWEPWRTQLSQGLTTWVEDSVSQRSDCHAWGCAPIYEFLAEVSGIRPAAPGWAVIAFKPRVSLFPELDAKIPFRGKSGSGIAHVKWRHEVDHTKVLLSLKMDSGEGAIIPVQVTFPDGQVQIIESLEDIVFTLEL